MALYFLLHDADAFHGRLRPALAEAWRRRSFAPCRPLAEWLRPAVEEFARRYHGPGDPLLFQVPELPFDRDLWRFFAGEALLYAARDIPEFQTVPETLCHLLAPGWDAGQRRPRAEFAAVEQAHYGARDLVFGGYYRPEAAGYNDRDDVARLADYLAGVDPERWTADALRGLPGLADDAERADEVAFAREWFPSLRDLYARAKADGLVVVCEEL